MRSTAPRILFLLVLALAGLAAVRLPAQTVQPGLETAVKWKWSVLPSEEKDWGLPLVEPVVTPVATPARGPGAAKKGPAAEKAAPSIDPGDYEVKKGDALAIISRKSGVPVKQLKLFNELSNDTIRIGQILKIPTAAEVAALATPTPIPVTPTPKPSPAAARTRKSPAKPTPAEPEVDPVAEATLIQVFLDRENFSSGPIDGVEAGAFGILLGIYGGVHPEVQTRDALRTKAAVVVGEPFTTYKLQKSDFRFISPPKATIIAKAANPPPPVKHAKDTGPRSVPPPPTGAPPPRPSRPSVTYEELLAAKFLGYRTPWEFVAERFHCDEAFLRRLNPNIKIAPDAETVFKVPNVTPFEIEKCFDGPVQPKANPAKPITAAIYDRTRLEIRQGDQLIACLPLSIARPGLHGRGSWTILGAIAGPRLSTHQEPTTNTPKATPGPGVAAPFGAAALAPQTPAPTPAPAPAATPAPAELGPEQILAAGPRNPVGVYWIDLAKADSKTPLPYGLHGTAIPGRMKTQESLGGLRLTNWDIARVVRLLPDGTPLAWTDARHPTGTGPGAEGAASPAPKPAPTVAP